MEIIDLLRLVEKKGLSEALKQYDSENAIKDIASEIVADIVPQEAEIVEEKPVEVKLKKNKKAGD